MQMSDKNSNLLVVLSQVDDLHVLEEQQVLELAETISKSINLSGLKRSINNACMNLSSVGEPCFGADVKYIALDNQARLNLIFKLLDSYTKIESYVNNYRRNKLDCRENSEYLCSFVLNTIDTLKTVKQYQDFKIQEHEENMKYLEETKRKLLN